MTGPGQVCVRGKKRYQKRGRTQGRKEKPSPVPGKRGETDLFARRPYPIAFIHGFSVYLSENPLYSTSGDLLLPGLQRSLSGEEDHYLEIGREGRARELIVQAYPKHVPKSANISHVPHHNFEH